MPRARRPVARKLKKVEKLQVVGVAKKIKKTKGKGRAPATKTKRVVKKVQRTKKIVKKQAPKKKTVKKNVKKSVKKTVVAPPAENKTPV